MKVEIARRKALAKLGLGIAAAYVAPVMLSLSSAKAEGGGGGGASGLRWGSSTSSGTRPTDPSG